MNLRRFFSRFVRREDRVSQAWLDAAGRREARIEWHSAPMQWPVKKLHNESPIWNRAKLRKVS